MYISKSTFFVFAVVVLVMTLSVTVFRSQGGPARPAQKGDASKKPIDHEELVERYPTADFDEVPPTDQTKRAALKQRQARYNDVAFGTPGPEDEAVAYIPEGRFDFPALPVNESDVIVVGQVAGSSAHMSENKKNVFSEFEIRVDEVFKGNNVVTLSSMIIVERLGGYLKRPNGPKALLFIPGYGMPEVGTRNVFFLKNLSPGFSIVTAYELNPHGVVALDQSKQFLQFNGQSEATFLTALREAIPTPRGEKSDSRWQVFDDDADVIQSLDRHVLNLTKACAVVRSTVVSNLVREIS